MCSTLPLPVDLGICSITPTYSFTYSALTYNASGIPNLQHLTDIANSIGTAESYHFTYATGSLAPPFGYDAAWNGVTTSRLTSISTPGISSYQFTYDAANAGELTKLTFPWGGYLQWDYVSQAYAGPNGNRYLREVGTRYLSAQSNGSSAWMCRVLRSDLEPSLRQKGKRARRVIIDT